MRFIFTTGLILIQIIVLNIYCQINPADEYPRLFEDVQMQGVYNDSKKFPDCIPLISADSIIVLYKQLKITNNFNLMDFVTENFDTVTSARTDFINDSNLYISDHIEKLWPVLTREPGVQTNSSLINLKYPYVVPGGRFNEIYYWDSYFTMLGLQAGDRVDLIKSMTDNFAYLIDRYGHIPNGNRTYYLSRSQPPFFSLMIELLIEETADSLFLTEYLPFLEKEYQYWMKGKDDIGKSGSSMHVVKITDEKYLNRYWDALKKPRPEAYKEDILVFNNAGQDSLIFRNLRAAAESGWDFSSRWLKDGKTLETIMTTSIIPVDLNCLLYNLERVLSVAYRYKSDIKMSKHYNNVSKTRKDMIIKYCWNEEKGYFFDYNWVTGNQTDVISVAGIYPLFFKIASAEQAERSVACLKEYLLKDYGVVTTNNITGQQWDSPNGWAPLQWMTYIALENYSFYKLSGEIAIKWMDLNIAVYKETGKMLEKYNVVDLKPGGGGEYPLQDGFGWTNGVLIKLQEMEMKKVR
ncbi:MAG: alpha,alpha-trehalase TreF [Bacteroidales bacterium]|nr:alpha,alpha-trehalase TreF [Bacteroidales bacterium]